MNLSAYFGLASWHLHHSGGQRNRTRLNVHSPYLQNISEKDIGDFIDSLDGLRDISQFKVINLAGNHLGRGVDRPAALHTLLTLSASSLQALNLSA